MALSDDDHLIHGSRMRALCGEEGSASFDLSKRTAAAYVGYILST